MALQPTQLAPVVIRGPDADRPDPSAVNAGSFFAPDDADRIDILRIVGGVRSWVSIATGPGVAATAQGSAGISVNGDFAAHPVSGALLFAVAPLTNPVFYVDPVSGNDNNAGTIGAPFATVNHALQALTPGWYGVATINLRAGTSTIGNKTVFPGALGNSSTTAGGIVINGVDNTDSGLGSRTSNGGTTGSLATFGTVVDSVGGLTVNQWRGSFIRFTSGGTLNGRSFEVASNTATTFTVAGTLPAAPTTETFVVETPAAVLSWPGSQAMQATGVVVFQNIQFTGPGGGNALRFSRGIFGLQKCRFANIGSAGIALRNGAMITDATALTIYVGDLSITQQCGAFFNGAPISTALSSASGLYSGGVSLSRCVFLNSALECLSPIQAQLLSCYFTGNSYVRGVYGPSVLLGQVQMDTVTPAAVLASAFIGAFGAVVVASKGAKVTIINAIIANTPSSPGPGDAVLIEDGSVGTMTAVNGSGNAGLGCRINRLSQLRQGNGNTVTGTAGDVQVGANAPILWAATTSTSTDPVELCIAGP